MNDGLVTIDRAWAMPSGNTFSIKPIKELVEECVLAVDVSNGGCIIDPFANESSYGTITNDLNPDMPTDYHMDALEFLRTRGDEEADLVLYDPPYSITQASTLYKSYGKKRLEVNVANMRYWKLVKDEIARVTKPGGVVLSCGWSTNGMGKGRGFTLRRIRIVAHGGSKNDTLVTIEEKVGA